MEQAGQQSNGPNHNYPASEGPESFKIFWKNNKFEKTNNFKICHTKTEAHQRPVPPKEAGGAGGAVPECGPGISGPPAEIFEGVANFEIELQSPGFQGFQMPALLLK